MADTSKALQGGLAGAGTGAAIGSVIPVVGTVAGAGAGALIGALPGLMSDDPEIAARQMAEAEARARALEQKALEDILSIPDPVMRDLQTQNYVQQGIITPESEQAITTGPSELKQISLDPRMREAQLDALSTMQTLGRTAFTPEEKLALDQQRLQQVRDLQAQQQGILQNRQMRGLAGGGDELAAQLQGAQAGAELAQQQGAQRAAMAQQRALSAMSSAAGLAKGMESSEYERQAAAARAQDEINRFNVGQQSGAQQRNISGRMTSQLANLGEQQRISEKNIEQDLAAQKYRNALAQDRFSNALSRQQTANVPRSSMAAGLRGQASGLRADQAAADQRFTSALGGAAQAGQGIAKGISSQETPELTEEQKALNAFKATEDNALTLAENKKLKVPKTGVAMGVRG